MDSLIIFGGSFDPIHNGHLRIAHAASMALNADVVFVPAKAARWKTHCATPKQRLDMLKLAIRHDGSPAFSIDLHDMKTESEENYSIDLVRYMKKAHKGVKLYLLIGADEVNSFPRWKDPEEICRLATPLYVTRPDIELDDAVLSRYRMQRLDYDGSGPVSSSKVRSLQDIDIPLVVREYIEKNNLYYIERLGKLLREKRLHHSISVANLAYIIAKKNMVEDYQKAYIAGLLHDCGKEIPAEAAKRIMKESFPQYLSMPEWSHHQFVGAYLAKTKFGIEDPVILDAIEFHATGKAHMAPISKIIYASDKIDPTRGYDSTKMISACYRHYYVGFMYVLKENRDFLLSKGKSVDNPLTKECFNLYLGDRDDE